MNGVVAALGSALRAPASLKTLASHVKASTCWPSLAARGIATSFIKCVLTHYTMNESELVLLVSKYITLVATFLVNKSCLCCLMPTCKAKSLPTPNGLRR